MAELKWRSIRRLRLPSTLVTYELKKLSTFKENKFNSIIILTSALVYLKKEKEKKGKHSLSESVVEFNYHHTSQMRRSFYKISVCGV